MRRKYNTWEPASNILTPELLEEYKVGKKTADNGDAVAESPKKSAKAANHSPAPATNGESAESAAAGNRVRRKRVRNYHIDTADHAQKNSVATLSPECAVEFTNVAIEEAPVAETVKEEPIDGPPAKKAAEEAEEKPAVTHTVAEVAEFRFVEQELNEKPLASATVPRRYTVDHEMDDPGSDEDDGGDGSGEAEVENEDSEYSTAGHSGGDAKNRRRNSEPSWARKGYKDWDEKEEELLLAALKKYGPRFFGTAAIVSVWSRIDL